MYRNTLPRHSRTGLLAIGFYRDGRPIWPVLGGSSPQEPSTEDKPDEDKGDGKADKLDAAALLAAKEKELSELRVHARNHEDRAKLNAAAAKELAELKKSMLTDREKDIEAAKIAGRQEAYKEFADKLVDAEIKAANGGRLTDKQVSALLDGLDRTRFMTEGGEVDSGKISSFIDGLAPAKQESPNGTPKAPALDFGQGRREDSAKPSVATGAALYESMKGNK